MSTQTSSHTVVVHHLTNSRSERILWLLEELGVEYTVKVHYRTAMYLAPDSLREVSPMGKAPMIELDGKLLMESGAIIHELLNVFPSVPAVESKAGYDSTYWSHACEGSLMSFLVPSLALGKAAAYFPFFMIGASALNKWFQGWTGKNAQNALDEAERFLEQHPQFSGTDKLGEGDFMMEFPLNSIAYGGRKNAFVLGPKTQAWIDAVRARPAFERAMARMKEEEEKQKTKE